MVQFNRELSSSVIVRLFCVQGLLDSLRCCTSLFGKHNHNNHNVYIYNEMMMMMIELVVYDLSFILIVKTLTSQMDDDIKLKTYGRLMNVLSFWSINDEDETITKCSTLLNMDLPLMNEYALECL